MIWKFTFVLIMFSLPLLMRAQAPLNWSLDEINPGEDISTAPDETKFTEGSKSLHAVLNSGEAPYLVSDDFTVTPGAAYDFSIRVFDNDTNGQVKIYADFFDIYGNDIYGKDPVFPPDSSEWQTISWSGLVPSMAVKGFILMKFYCQPEPYHFETASQCWLDDVRFEQQGGPNLVINGGFEQWSLSAGDKTVPSEPVRLYPNPVGDYLVVELNIPLERMVITDLTGQNQLDVKLTGEHEFRTGTSNLPKGIYMVAFYGRNGVVINKKLVKY